MVNEEGLASKPVQAMNAEQAELYERIQAFSLDQHGAQLSFSKRLARDNACSIEYAQRVIEEYKKFAFLAVAAEHPVTPSDQVDQVWHLHLTYTRSYWDEFCSEVLQTSLHHDPTLGGEAENQKFDDWYSKTLESYEQFFGTEPPVEIWSVPEDRFGRDLHFVRLNTQQNWVLPKLQVQKGAVTSAVVLSTLILSGCYVGSAESSVNPSGALLLIFFFAAAAYGAIRTFAGVLDFIKDPSRSRIGGGWSSGNWGVGDDGSGWNWWSSDSHHSGGTGGSDGGGGCGGGGGGGGGGCGGGGCGGG